MNDNERRYENRGRLDFQIGKGAEYAPKGDDFWDSREQKARYRAAYEHGYLQESLLKRAKQDAEENTTYSSEPMSGFDKFCMWLFIIFVLLVALLAFSLAKSVWNGVFGKSGLLPGADAYFGAPPPSRVIVGPPSGTPPQLLQSSPASRQDQNVQSPPPQELEPPQEVQSQEQPQTTVSEGTKTLITRMVFSSDVSHGNPQQNDTFSVPVGSPAGLYIEYTDMSPDDYISTGLSIAGYGNGEIICPPYRLGNTSGNYWCQTHPQRPGRYRLTIFRNNVAMTGAEFTVY